MLDLFVFADAGTISDKKFSIDTFRLSYGIGARLELLNRVPIVLGRIPCESGYKKRS
jgi:hypothetical protein